MEAKFLTLIERLQPKPEYMTLFRQIVLDVWKDRQVESSKVTAAIASRLEELSRRKQRVVDAFLHERVIDKDTYQEQLERVGEEICSS